MHDVIAKIIENSDDVFTWFGTLIAATTVVAGLLSVAGKALQRVALETQTDLDDRVASALVKASAEIGIFLSKCAALLPAVRLKSK